MITISDIDKSAESKIAKLTDLPEATVHKVIEVLRLIDKLSETVKE